jgi:4-hydroxy-tetrahydrodipicolinate reductase
MRYNIGERGFMADLKIGVMGAAGRMGGAVIRQVTDTAGMAVVAACDAVGNSALGRDAGELAGVGKLGVTVGSDAAAAVVASDVIIEFSTPAATLAHVALAASKGIAHVIGTTGLDEAGRAKLAEAAQRAAIVHAPNMSLAVNVLFALTRQVAAMLDPEFDIEIVEMHHRHKVDAPSGTALELGRRAAEGRQVRLDQVARMTREGQVGARKKGEIGFATLRGGDVVGDHTVIFAADGERLEFGHKAASRQIFARGAVHAARWAHGRKPGLYDMADVLGLK